ncbi:MAG: hypothetical protein ACFB0D_04685 [Phormidesmis sp.]
MDSEAQGQNVNTLRLLRISNALGFFSSQDDQARWRIQPSESEDFWYLQQEGERWLLVVNQVPQILLRLAEALAFLQREAIGKPP